MPDWIDRRIDEIQEEVCGTSEEVPKQVADLLRSLLRDKLTERVRPQELKEIIRTLAEANSKAQ